MTIAERNTHRARLWREWNTYIDAGNSLAALSVAVELEQLDREPTSDADPADAYVRGEITFAELQARRKGDKA